MVGLENFVYFSHIHGSRAVANAMFSVLNTFSNYRLAEAGEFSKRYKNKVQLSTIRNNLERI